MYFKRTAPAVQRCKDQQQRCSYGRARVGARRYSNGLVATLAMGAAAPLVKPADRELAGNLMALALTLGLAAGSLLSFALVATLKYI